MKIHKDIVEFDTECFVNTKICNIFNVSKYSLELEQLLGR